jgi:hypothetical protein
MTPIHNLILDKSYLQGAQPEHIEWLRARYVVFMPDVLFYELLTAEESERMHCFRHLPPGENPVVVLPGVGDLLQYEAKYRKACTPLSERQWVARFKFNDAFREPGVKLSLEDQTVIDELQAKTVKNLENLKGALSSVDGFFPELKGLGPGERPDRISDVKKAIAEDWRMIREIYGMIHGPEFPPAEVIDPSWALFRWLQVWLVAAVDYVHKYGKNIHTPSAKRFMNEYHDLDYTIAATLAEGLASVDIPMVARFQLLCPTGLVISQFNR